MNKRICYLHQYFKFPNESGGTRSYDLATSFMKHGHKVIVVTSTSDPKYNTRSKWSIIEKNGLEVHYTYIPYDNSQPYLKRSLVFMQFLWDAIFKLIHLRVDIVLATSTPLTIGIPALIKRWMHKTPFIFEVRDVWPEAVIAIGAIKNRYMQKGLYMMEQIIYKNSAAIVSLSTDMETSILKRYPDVKAKPHAVIENISEISRFQCEGVVQKGYLKKLLGFSPRFTVLYAGTFGKVNGIDYVINLAAMVNELEADITFVLIGDGAQKEEIKQKAIDKGLLGVNIFILDPIAKDNLPKLYRDCDVGSSFVIDVKELWANSANKFFDTLAAGKPVLINHEGWQSELINQENIGYVLSPTLDIKDAEAFISYCNNNDIMKQQGVNSLKVAKTKFSLDVAVAKYISIIEAVSKF